MKSIKAISAIFCAIALSHCGATSPPQAPIDSENVTQILRNTDQASPPKQLFMGQDLDAIRGYFSSDCCLTPDGLTGYLNLYTLLSPPGYGGLGITSDDTLISPEHSWGAGPVGLFQTATEFGIDDIAIGLSITENEHPGALADLVNGKYDDEIRHLAAFIKQYIKGTAYLRIGYEFDGVWNAGYENPTQYKNSWKRIVDIIRSEKTENVKFVWQSSASSADDAIEGKHEDIMTWYPGDDYVDLFAISWFMQPEETRTVDGYQTATPQALSDEVLFMARSRNKKVMIAEASPQAFDLKELTTAHHSPVWDGISGSETKQLSSDEIWDLWFAPMFDYMQKNYDVITTLAYINVDWDSQPMWGKPYNSGYWGDTRLETNPVIADKFNQAIKMWKNSSQTNSTIRQEK